MIAKRLMIIENNDALVEEITSVCEKLGFEVRVNYDALDAIIRAVEDRPDLILFDADAAAVGSEDFAEVLARDRRFLSIPLIAIVEITDRHALRLYLARGLAVATKRMDDSKHLRKELLRLLKPYARIESSVRRDCHDGSHTKVVA